MARQGVFDGRSVAFGGRWRFCGVGDPENGLLICSASLNSCSRRFVDMVRLETKFRHGYALPGEDQGRPGA